MATPKKSPKDQFIDTLYTQATGTWGQALTSAEKITLRTNITRIVNAGYGAATKVKAKSTAALGTLGTTAIEQAIGVVGKYDAKAKKFVAAKPVDANQRFQYVGVDLDANGNPVRKDDARFTSLAQEQQTETLKGSADTEARLKQIGFTDTDLIEFRKIATDSLSGQEYARRLRETEAYKNRFAGMRMRDGKFSAVNEAEYIEIENSYKKAVSAFTGQDLNKLVWNKEQNRYYTEREAMAQLIGNDVSPVEFQGRINRAQQWAASANPEIKQAMKQFYGVEENDLMAYAFDPTSNDVVLQQRAATASIASAAAKAGFDIFNSATVNRAGALAATLATLPAAAAVSETMPATPMAPGLPGELTKDYIEGLVSGGVALTGNEQADAARIAAQEEQVISAVGEAGIERQTAQLLAGIDKVNLSAQEQVEARLAGQSAQGGGTGPAGALVAREKVRKLASSERARFTGSSGGKELFDTNVSGSF
jgi:hypothetical protein